MLRWYITGFIGALGATLAYFHVGSPFRPGAESAYVLGQIVGAGLAPFIFGAVAAGLLGLVMTKTPGGFHRRMNWMALVVLVLSVASQSARIAR
jgi:hypothetical protein